MRSQQGLGAGGTSACFGRPRLRGGGLDRIYSHSASKEPTQLAGILGWKGFSIWLKGACRKQGAPDVTPDSQRQDLQLTPGAARPKAILTSSTQTTDSFSSFMARSELQGLSSSQKSRPKEMTYTFTVRAASRKGSRARRSPSPALDLGAAGQGSKRSRA